MDARALEPIEFPQQKIGAPPFHTFISRNGNCYSPNMITLMTAKQQNHLDKILAQPENSRTCAACGQVFLLQMYPSPLSELSCQMCSW